MQRRLHWWTACLVLIAFPLGWLMVGVSLDQLLLKFALYQLHKTIGIVVFALALARAAIRARRGRPAWERGVFAWQREAARTMHAALYALLVLVPVLGYFTAATAPARIPTLFLGILPIPHVVGADPFWFGILRQVHRALAVLLVALASAHAAAAIANHVAGQKSLRMMWHGR
ncbi:MAG: cytochrome b [Acetobacteraceae bacterium]